MVQDVELVVMLRKVRLIALDVDGVLTDGGIFIAEGSEFKRFDIKDGHGIVVAQRAGISFALISGRDSRATSIRAQELGIREVHQGVRDKIAILKQVAGATGMTQDAVLYMGDDVQDLGAMKWAGCSAAPADAAPDVLSRAAIITHARGGHGAVREVIDLVLKAQGTWQAVIDAYLK